MSVKTNWRQGCGQRAPFTIADEMVNWYNHVGEHTVYQAGAVHAYNS